MKSPSSAPVSTSFPWTALLRYSLGFLLVGIFGFGMSIYQTAQDNARRQEHLNLVAHYCALVDQLDSIKVEGTYNSQVLSDARQAIEELSTALKNGVVSSEELGKFNIYDPEMGNWLTIYRTRLDVFGGQEKLRKLKAHADHPRKGWSAATEIQEAQILGVEINDINRKVYNHRYEVGYVNASRADVANLIKRVKNPALPPVEIFGLDYFDGVPAE